MNKFLVFTNPFVNFLSIITNVVFIVLIYDNYNNVVGKNNHLKITLGMLFV